MVSFLVLLQTQQFNKLAICTNGVVNTCTDANYYSRLCYLSKKDEMEFLRIYSFP